MRWLTPLVAAAALPCLAQDVYDLPWRIAANGDLEVRPLAEGIGATELQFGEWTAMFPELFHRAVATPDLAWLGEWGPMLALPLVAHGEGGAAAIDEAPLRMRKLGIPTTIDYVPLLRLRPDALTDLLHVRHVAGFDLGVTTFALRKLASDTKRDPFARAAAAAALAARPSAADDAAQVAEVRARRNGAAALQCGLVHLPDDVDLVLGVHGAALPTMAPLLRAWREYVMRFHSSAVLSSGGAVSAHSMTTGQLLMDRPGQLPFEIARRCGNWRVDHALLAVRGGDRAGFWVHLGGVFQPAGIAAGLRDGDFEVHAASDEEVRASVHGWRVHATKTELRAWPEDFEPGTCGSRVPLLQDRAAHDAAPIWLHVPPTSRFATKLGGGCTFDARFDPNTANVTATATAPDEPRAANVLAAWRDWQGARRCDADGKVEADGEMTWGQLAAAPVGCLESLQSRLVWRRLVQQVRVETEGTTLRWFLDLAVFSRVDLVRVLAASPTHLLESW